jgi:hypothetical protein
MGRLPMISRISRRALLACWTASVLAVGLLTVIAPSGSALARRPGASSPIAPIAPIAPIPPLPLSIAVVEEEGRPVQDAAWVDAQIAEAVRLFEPLGLPLSKASSRALPASFARMETRADRDALAAALEPKRINVMVVSSLRDVDDPQRYRMGVHWRHRGTPAKHYIIVSATARPTTLAHELGHYFGLGHSDVTDNVMSYSRTGGPVFFDPKQAERMRSRARTYVSAKLLDPAQGAAAAPVSPAAPAP